MRNLLYYPYINLPKTDWTIRALLYFDNIASIVPAQYFMEPRLYDPFMREVIQDELIIPINPMEVLEHPWEVSGKFNEYLNNNRSKFERRRFAFRQQEATHIHRAKFSFENISHKLHVGK